MRTIYHRIYYRSRTDVFKLYHITDTHTGHYGCDEEKLKRIVQTIRDDPFAFWGGGGDMLDCIPRKGDKRYRESTVAPWLSGVDDIVTRQKERFLDIIYPIADKCLYLVKGNHEDTYLSYYDRDVYREIVKEIADQSGRTIADLALGWEGFVQLNFFRGTEDKHGGSWLLTIYTHHGAGGGRKAGGHALRLEELLHTYDADIVLSGHRHIHQSVKKHTVHPDGDSSKLRPRIGVFCPGLLKSYLGENNEGLPRDNYPQQKNMAPVGTGVAYLVIQPAKKWIMLPWECEY